MTDQDLLELHDRISQLAEKLAGLLDTVPTLHERIKTLEETLLLMRHQQQTTPRGYRRNALTKKTKK